MGNQLENTNNDKNEFEIISTANDSNSKGLIIGNAIKAGGELLGVGIQAICNVVNKSKDIEIQKLKNENERLIQKEKEKKEKKQELKLQLEKKENDFYEKQIVKFSYNENLFDKEEIKNIIIEKKLLNDFDKIKINNIFMKQIEDKIMNTIELSKDKLKKCERLNIYLMGITGVGKTSLKNSICDKLYSQEKFGGRGTTMRQ